MDQKRIPTEDFPSSRSSCPTSFRRKRFIRISSSVCAIGTLALLCLTVWMTRGRKKPEPEKAVSAVSAADCYLCGEGGAGELPWGQDNIALISLNTFEGLVLDVNHYDRDGKLIEKNTGVLTMRSTGEKETGFSAFFTVLSDTGMASGSCALREDKTLDVRQAAELFCQDCLDQMLSEKGTGVGLVDLVARKAVPLERSCSGARVGNYAIHTDWDQQGTEVELWICYAPLRYQEKTKRSVPPWQKRPDF